MGNIHKDKSHEEQFEKEKAQEEKDVNLSEKDINSVLESAELTNAMLGKLYEIITSGDSALEETEATKTGEPKKVTDFLAWATPGLPVTEEQFDFAAQGIVGRISSDEDMKELERRVTVAITNNPDGDKTTIIEQVRNQLIIAKEATLIKHAQDFSNLVDFVPDVSGKSNDKLRTLYDKGKVSDTYKYILDFSQVKSASLTEEEREKIDKFRKLIESTTVEKVNILGETVKSVEPSPITKTYGEYQSKYEDAVLTYNKYRIEAMSDDPQKLRFWALNGPTLRNKVKSAKAEWVSLGYKNEYEQIAAYIDQIQARDLSLLKAEYKDLLERLRLSNPDTLEEFYYTTLTPASFATSSGWTEFSFKSSEKSTSDRTDKSSQSSSWGASGGVNAGSIFSTSASYSTNKDTSTTDILGKVGKKEFTCSFEVAQVRIVRPWMKESFLNSKYWRFAEKDTTECISDGNTPPDGLMPAYPTSMIVVRNVTISFDKSVDLKSVWEEEVKSSREAKAKIKILCFDASGNYSRENADSVSGDCGVTFKDKSSITIPGMQVIGFNCHVLDKTPDPTTEEGIEWT